MENAQYQGAADRRSRSHSETLERFADVRAQIIAVREEYMRMRLMLKALCLLGWSVDKVSMYDEEGVEGWRWTDPQGHEYCEAGDWNDLPPLPEAARRALNSKEH